MPYLLYVYLYQVRQDVDILLQYKPRRPLWVLMHDSFNPACRRGIKGAAWRSSPHVHWVDFDFIPGFLNSVPGWEDQLWGGLAAALMLPEPRQGDIAWGELLGRQFDKLLPLATNP